jgi:two-component system, cell cycle response regulator
MNILLIEDDPTDRKLLRAVLNSSGDRVIEQAAAEEAFEAIRRERPELILLDLKLPGMDGLALARRLKADDETRPIPIVAVTVGAEEFSREEALRAGCDAYILKPVNTRKFAEQVAQVKNLKH